MSILHLAVPKRRLSLPGYVSASILMSLGGFLNGYDTGSAGSVTEMESFISVMGHISATTRGFVVSIILLTGIVPSIVTGYFADRFGRLATVKAGAFVFTIGVVLEASSSNLPMFILGRAISGVGQGLWLGNVSVYITEIAPQASRGMLVSVPQLIVTVGICAGFFTCYGTSRIPNSMSWRIPYIIQASVAVMFGLGACVFPESPRWLMSRGERDKAIYALGKLGVPQAEAERDILRGADEPVVVSSSAREKFMLPFRKPYRQRTVLGLFILGMVQLSGIDGVLFYAPTLFAQAGIPSQTASFLASGISAILIFAISIPAFLFADKWGRRTSALSGGVVLSTCMFIIGALYASNSVSSEGSGRWVVVTSIFVFVLAYAASWGIVGRIYASEIQPMHTRAGANSIAQGLNFFTNWLVSMITPPFLASSSFGPYFLFSSLTLGTVTFLALYMPETRGMSLEAIQEAFQIPIGQNFVSRMRKFFATSMHPHRNGGREFEMNSRNAEDSRATPSAPVASSGANSIGRVQVSSSMSIE